MPALEQELVRDVRELPPGRDVAGRALAGDLLDEVDALVEHGCLLLAGHRDRVLVGVAVDADLVAGRDDLLGLGGEGLDRVARDEPRGPEAVPLEQLQEARSSDLTGEEAAGDVVGGVLATVRAEPARDRVDVDAVRDEDLLGHLPHLPARGSDDSNVQPLRCPPERALGRRGRRPPRARDPDGARSSGARAVRPRGAGVGGQYVVSDGKGRTEVADDLAAPLGGGGAARGAAPRPARSRAPGHAREQDARRPRDGLSRQREDDADRARCSSDPELGETAVIVNELGEIGIDHASSAGSTSGPSCSRRAASAARSAATSRRSSATWSTAARAARSHRSRASSSRRRASPTRRRSWRRSSPNRSSATSTSSSR